MRGLSILDKKKITILFFMVVFIMGIFTVVKAGDRYSIFKIKRELKAQTRSLRPIRDVGGSPEYSSYGPGNYEREIMFDGRRRRYELHVPRGYDKSRKWPVVLNFHGGGGRAGTARLQTGMDVKSDSAGFIVVYPDGTGKYAGRLLTWNAGVCCGYAKDNKVDDVGFTRELLRDLSGIFNVDPKRVYATGLSNGALMAQRLGCELSDKIAAIAPVAGVRGVSRCKPERAVSVMHFHGTADRNDPYDGGVGANSAARVNFISVRESIDGWINIDKCSTKPTETYKRGDARVDVYCAPGGAEVVLVTIEGGGHTWPGGRRMLPKRKIGKISSNVPANDMMWDFFQRHPMK